MTVERFKTASGLTRVHFTPHDAEPDRALRGAAEIYERAHAWGHLPMEMGFQAFLAAMERGDDPFMRVGY